MVRIHFPPAESRANFISPHWVLTTSSHVATGLSPEAAQRWSCLHFDPQSYRVWQEGTRLQPFPAGLKCRTVVFDMPYFDLNAAPRVRGLVSWGARRSQGELLVDATKLLKRKAQNVSSWSSTGPTSSPDQSTDLVSK
jgi:hypothetical protein